MLSIIYIPHLLSNNGISGPFNRMANHINLIYTMEIKNRESRAQLIFQKPDNPRNMLKRMIQVTLSILLTAVILFISAGTTHWPYAWILILVSVVVIIINAFIFPAELISERGRKKENVEKWDKLISGLMIIPWILIYLVAGLDHRFEWTARHSIWIHMTGLIFFILGSAMVSWAMVSNNYFSTAVRIQYDRGHKVETGGPYQYIRHPGYLGMIVYLCFTPLLLGTLWALLPAFLTSSLLMIRTSLENKTLENKLDGYREYSKKVKYRLFPGIW